MTGYASDGGVQVLAVDAGDAATTRRALGMIALSVLLSMDTISSLRVERRAARCGQPRYWTVPEPIVGGTTA